MAKKSKRRPRSAKTQKIVVGQVTHYFPKAKAAAVRVTGAGFQIGDRLYFERKQGGFCHLVRSIQIDRVPVLAALKNQEVGIGLPREVNEGDEVFLRRP